MSDIQPIIIQVILAIIASSFLVTVFNIVYTDFMKNPYIVSDVSTPSSSKFSIDIHNQGLEPAENLTVTVKSLEPFDSKSVYVFSTKDLNIIKNTSTIFSFSVPKFVQGLGEYVHLEFNTLNKRGGASLDDIIVYSSYDQGSNYHEGNAVSLPSDSVRNFFLRTDILLVMFGFVIPILIYPIFLWKFFGRYRKRGRRKRVEVIDKDLARIKNLIIDTEQTGDDRYWEFRLATGDLAKHTRFLRFEDSRKINNLIYYVKDRTRWMQYLNKKPLLQPIIEIIRAPKIGYQQKMEKEQSDVEKREKERNYAEKELEALNLNIKDLIKEIDKIDWEKNYLSVH